MSRMSLPRLSKSQRMKKIKEMYPLHKTSQQMADVCGVNEKTIDRDLKAWKQSGGFEDWLQEEFFRLHQVMVTGEKETLAYSNVSQLLGKSMTQRIQAKTEVSGLSPIQIVFDAGMKEDESGEKSPG